MIVPAASVTGIRGVGGGCWRIAIVLLVVASSSLELASGCAGDARTIVSLREQAERAGRTVCGEILELREDLAAAGGNQCTG